MNKFRLLPSTDLVMQKMSEIFVDLSKLQLKDIINDFLDDIRKNIENYSENDLEHTKLFVQLEAYVQKKSQANLRSVINATGVVIHTNLGRSRLAKKAADRVYNIAINYNNLEYDLNTQARGSRLSHIEEKLCKITGAEAGIVVNNNAAAVLLILDTFCKSKEVIVSRSQLVEIGGSFRIPEIMCNSGSILKEIGTTNRTHLFDYEKAINENTAAIMHIHSSNFKIIGFTKEVPNKDLADLAHKNKMPFIVDLGSGALIDLAKYGFEAELTVQETLESGADLVSFSGDKVLGSAQAGIIVGKKVFIDKLKKNQLLRALRVDKMCLAALEETLNFYFDEVLAIKNIPTLRDICISEEDLNKKAKKLLSITQKYFKENNIQAKTKIIKSNSRIGGGSYPEYDLASYALSLEFDKIQDIKSALINQTTPIITRIEDNRILFDVRTMDIADFNYVALSLTNIIRNIK